MCAFRRRGVEDAHQHAKLRMPLGQVRIVGAEGAIYLDAQEGGAPGERCLSAPRGMQCAGTEARRDMQYAAAARRHGPTRRGVD